MASKNFFSQLGEGAKRLVGGGQEGYWNSLYEMIKDPSQKKVGKGIASIPHGIGSGISSIFGYLPKELDKDNRR